MASIKEEAQRLVDNLSDDATWDDLMYEIYVNKKVAQGEEALAGGKVVPHEKAHKRVVKR